MVAIQQLSLHNYPAVTVEAADHILLQYVLEIP